MISDYSLFGVKPEMYNGNGVVRPKCVCHGKFGMFLSVPIGAHTLSCVQVSKVCERKRPKNSINRQTRPVATSESAPALHESAEKGNSVQNFERKRLFRK